MLHERAVYLTICRNRNVRLLGGPEGPTCPVVWASVLLPDIAQEGLPRSVGGKGQNGGLDERAPAGRRAAFTRSFPASGPPSRDYSERALGRRSSASRQHARGPTLIPARSSPRSARTPPRRPQPAAPTEPSTDDAPARTCGNASDPPAPSSDAPDKTDSGSTSDEVRSQPGSAHFRRSYIGHHHIGERNPRAGWVGYSRLKKPEPEALFAAGVIAVGVVMRRFGR